jgi:hypothetical protein
LIQEADRVRKIAADAVPRRRATRGDFAHPTRRNFALLHFMTP